MALRKSGAPRLLERQETPPAIEFIPPPEPWPGWPVGWATSWNGGISGDSLALRSSVVFRCVDLITGAIASLPLFQFTPEREPVEPPAAWVQNPEPTVYVSRRDAIGAVVSSLLFRGNAYLFVTARYADGYPQHWLALNPDAVTVRANPNTGEAVYEVDGTRIPSDRIYHLRHQTKAGEILGVGPLQSVADNLLALTEAERWALDSLGKGMLPQGILSFPDDLSDKQSAELRTAWEAQPGAVRVLSGGLSFSGVSLSPKESMLLERMDFDARSIATAFGLPAQMLNLSNEGGGLHYSSSEMDLRALWQLTLNPIADNLERAFSTMLPGKQIVEFDEYAYLAGNFTEQAAVATQLVAAKIWTVNEARAKFGLPEIDEPDEQPPAIEPPLRVVPAPENDDNGVAQ